VSAAAASLVNGEPQDLVSIRDRGLQYGDGLFETLRCEGGAIRWFDRHLARLRLGCERLGLSPPDGPLLRAEVEALVKGAPRALAKIVLTRGPALARGYRPHGGERPTRIVSVYPWPAPAAGPFRLELSPVPLGCNPLLAGIKHLNRLEQVLAQRAAAGMGCDEVVMCASEGEGEPVSGSMSNLFVAHNGEWLTPPLARCGVAGIMRELVLALAPRAGVTARVAPLTTAQLAAATALIVTNVRLGLQPVHWYQGRPLVVDERGARLQELIDGTP
jgi:4-amino-4-deoxychorismate lyase